MAHTIKGSEGGRLQYIPRRPYRIYLYYLCARWNANRKIWLRSIWEVNGENDLEVYFMVVFIVELRQHRMGTAKDRYRHKRIG